MTKAACNGNQLLLQDADPLDWTPEPLQAITQWMKWLFNCNVSVALEKNKALYITLCFLFPGKVHQNVNCNTRAELVEHAEHYRLTFHTLRVAQVDFFHLICYRDDAENKSAVRSPTRLRAQTKLYETYEADMTQFVFVLIMFLHFMRFRQFLCLLCCSKTPQRNTDGGETFTYIPWK